MAQQQQQQFGNERQPLVQNDNSGYNNNNYNQQQYNNNQQYNQQQQQPYNTQQQYNNHGGYPQQQQQQYQQQQPQQQNLYQGAPPAGPPGSVLEPMDDTNRAHCYFFGPMRAERHIRPYNLRQRCCTNQTAQQVPVHWFDGGEGWVTRYFVDAQPFSWASENPGSYRCNVIVPSTGRPCGYEVRDSSCCCGPCWQPRGKAPREMAEHLASHGVQPPVKREWASDLCQTDGLCEACLCSPCTGSRQMMATFGHRDTFSLLYCLMFCSVPHCHHHKHHPDESAERHGGCHACLAAYWTRKYVKHLQNIDEGCCKTLCFAMCCPHCSLAQTFREFTAAGVWPGGICATDAPVQNAHGYPSGPIMGSSVGGIQ